MVNMAKKMMQEISVMDYDKDQEEYNEKLSVG